MTSDHTSSEELASQGRGSDGYRQGRALAERAYLLGRAVRERRVALGLSQLELATRGGMTQPALSRPRSRDCPTRCRALSAPAEMSAVPGLLQ